MLQEALSLSLVRPEDEIDIANEFTLSRKTAIARPGVRRRQSKMDHPKSYNVSFRFRALPPHRLDDAMAFNADRASKYPRKEMAPRHGYTQEGLKCCLVCASSANSSDVAA
jgi:hypothetical protein